MDNSGISEYTYTVIGMKMRKKGAAYAKSNVKNKKYYQGTDDQESKQNRKAIVAIVIQILKLGLGGSLCILLCELCVSFLLNREAKDRTAHEDSIKKSAEVILNREIGKPQAFIE